MDSKVFFIQNCMYPEVLHGTLHRPHLHIVSDGGDGVVEAGPDLFSVQCSVYKSIISRIWLSQAISSQAALSQDAGEMSIVYVAR